jgi:putative PIN family toxin of toxin-antitoxin system
VAEPILSPRLLDELENVLGHDKFRSYIGLVEAREFVDLLRREFTVAPDLEGARHPRLADPGDDYLVALAQGNNAILVSGDKHLLDLAGNGAPVLSPADFLTAFA